MAQQPLREDSPSPLGGEVPASSLQDLLANFDPDPTDASISQIPGPTNSELAAAAEDEVPPSASWRLCHTVLNPASIWVCLLGELELFVHLESAMLLQGFGAEAKMVPRAATSERQWTAAMQEAVCTMHEQWRGESEGSLVPQNTAFFRRQGAGEDLAQPARQDGAIGALEAVIHAETVAADL